jgi:RNA polymerase sigma-70 factor (ECF subfamily)
MEHPKSHDGSVASAGLFLPAQPLGVPRELSTTRHPSPDILRLTSGLAKNDDAAYREFYARYFDRLLRYLLVVTRGREDSARDALQSTLLRVARHARRFDSEPAFWSWLTVLARSALVDDTRKRSRYASLLERFLHSRLSSTSSNPAASDADQRLEAALEAALDALPPDDRALLEQKYFDGASVDQIAAESGATGKSVESRLVRARRRLKESMLLTLRDEK